MESFSNNEEPKPKITIEVAGNERVRIEVELVKSGPLNEFGVPSWHDYKGPSSGTTYRADWNEVERKYIAYPMD